MDLFIDSPQSFIEEFWKDKLVKFVEKEYRLRSIRFILIDISLNCSGHDQDQQYIRCEDYRVNIRRGNTIIQILEKSGKTTVWGRKGTPKIYDIKLQYILINIPIQIHLTDIETKFEAVIFNNVNQAFRYGSRVEIIKSEKANGQNAQISYSYQLDAWIICSKNVSLAAIQLQDLQYYNGDRYQFAKEIAIQWFKLLSGINKSNIPKLKKLLDGYTIIGQYCGNPKYQHLIKYKQINILWFALVDNNSYQYCFDPFKSRQQLKDFGFKFVSLKSMAICSNKKSFYSELQKLYLKTASASISDKQFGQQGSIVYFVEHIQEKNSKKLKVIGAGKLKTLQYRFFRKIRQKLSTFNSKNNNSQNSIIQKYQKQCKVLMKDNESNPPYPLLYYTQILQAGLKFVAKYQISDLELRRNFITLLNMIFYTSNKGIPLTKDLYLNDQLRTNIRSIQWSEYQANNCKTFVVYIPIGIPGLGKSYLANKMENHFKRLNYNYKILSSDKIRKQCMQTYLKKNTKATQNQAFQACGQIASKIFRQNLIDTLQLGFSKGYNKNKYFLFLDKNHTSQAIESTLKILKKQTPASCYFKTIYIIPKIQQRFVIGQYNFPFSLQIILAAIMSSQQRGNHELLTQNNPVNIGVIGFFLNLYNDFQILDYKQAFTRQFEFPYPTVKNLKNIDKISEALVQLLKNSSKQICRDVSTLKKFQKIIEELEIEYPTEQRIENEIQQLIGVGFAKIPTFMVTK